MAKDKQIRVELTAEVAGAVVEVLERKSREIEAKIVSLRLLVSEVGGAAQTGATGGRKQKRSFSAATKKKMAEAQRRRWAARGLSSAGA